MSHKDNTPSSRAWPIKALAAATIMGLIATSAQTNSTQINRKQIGDLEIYAPAKPGTATIFMMLDTSGSMGDGFIDDDYGSKYKNCGSRDVSAITSERITAVIYKRKLDASTTDGLLRDENGNTVKDFEDEHTRISFTPYGCTPSGNPTRYSRLVRLQIALIELLADNVYKSSSLRDTGTLADDYEIGLGNYSHGGNGRSGVVTVPTKALTAEQRATLIEAVKDLTATGGTPTAHALAESGAYMMGTTTISDVKVVAEREYSGRTAYWRRCYGNDSSLSYDDELGIAVYDCNNWGGWSDSYSTISSYVNTNSSIDHADNGRTYFAGDNSDSGYVNSVGNAKKQNENENAYISPLNPKECSGNGIYLLTDGEPNGSNSNRAKAVMNNSLSGATSSLSVSSCNGLSGGNSAGAWGCMADYAEILRNPVNNPLGLPIKTATVGFGKDFAGLTGTRSIIINGDAKEVVNCDSGRSVNANTRNLCKLGERKGDNEVKTFGDGGFYYTEESEDIAKSIVDFASGLVQIINTAPSGTITIPDDPYLAANQLPYAYLPMLDPSIASANSIWRGNLKKYNLDEGTLYGKNDNPLYEDSAGNLNAATQDIWQTVGMTAEGRPANNNIAAGGVYAQLKSPSSGLSSLRTVYVEDTLDDKKTPVLRKVAVDSSSGKPQNFDNLVDTVYSDNSEINKRRLLSFLGFSEVLKNDGQPTSTTKVKDLTLSKPANEVKVLGGVVHSIPTAVSYGADLDANGRITDDRDDYVLFGSMDGALHLVDADTGAEAFAIIPKLMMQKQPTALVEGSFKAEVGTPYFGVDAPWLVTTDYKYDLKNKKVTVDTTGDKGMYAYGGLRMGGEAFYGLDISDKSSPEIKFTITPNSLNGKSSSDFARLGRVWSKPTAAKIRLTKGSDDKKNADATDVLIFGGGYDMGYEDDQFIPTATQPAKGNAIYMINAKTGELIWSMTKSSSNNMIHSITGEITVLDRDNDGLMDHLYAADLGGQVFRADFENARIEQFGFAAIDKFKNTNVTRILNASAGVDSKYAYRFYNRPVVSFYRNTGGYDNGNIFALVNVISGNRSAPLSTLRDDNKYANRVYGIIDTDITNADLYKSGFTPTVANLNDSSLLDLSAQLGNTPDKAKKETVKQKMLGQAKSAEKVNGVKPTHKGWYYPLTRFDGYNKVRYNKGVGDMAAINNLLYTTVYNPDKLYGSVSSCAARIMGGSERQLYCLPYGICMDDDSTTGTGGYVPAGQGIQELTLGAYNADNRDIKVLIGTTTISERITAENRADYGSDSFKNDSNIKDLYPGTVGGKPVLAGGDGSASEYLFNERYTLQPKAWYEQNSNQ